MSLALFPQGAALQRQGVSKIASLPSPTGGWNTRDSIESMPPTDAVELRNMIPKLGSVISRKGYSTFVADIAGDIGGAWASGPVETLMELTVGSSNRLLAAMDGGLARVDTGTATEVKVRATYTVDRWQWTTFTPSAAPDTPYIFAANGTDTPWKWDGTTHSTWAITPTAGAITDADVIWVFSFKNRMFIGEKDSRNFWYSALGDGTNFTRFPLSGVRGAQGNILFMGAMTRDTGSGPDDYAVFVTDAGSVIVYDGTDPGDATAWSLVGVYQIPKPIQSRRAHLQLFGDIVIATELDYIFLASALQNSGAVILEPSKLTGAMQTAAATYKDNYGWEMVNSPNDSLLLSSIPLETDAQYQQHVVNVQTRAPALFTGLNFSTWISFNGKLYAGGTNAIYRVLTGFQDDADGSANPIIVSAQTAWTDLGLPSLKQVTATRPIVKSQGDILFQSEIGVDFLDPSIHAPYSAGPAGATTLWGDTAATTTLWGDTAATTTYWAGTATVSPSSSREWRLGGARGTDFTYRIAVNILDQSIEWLSTDFKVKQCLRF